ncbi:SPOR domain-containing protein [Legionella fallonii]|uniref:Sporulation domain protein n=1 Tax=Legionella fallonii LLAP-10 TaxID=1212491 RepID=A0A098G5D0_9GAMM|nr:SPOR domain-containing protein [Legionella fallonii]CEG56695.1 Sporulation domain protein [Legionella fallonii LLAP-10]
MKLEMDEKLKHRLIGLAVIISLGAIFAPAMMKKSSQSLDHNMSVNIKLPQKPIAPDVVLSDEKEMFKTIKVAKVEIQPVPEGRQLTEMVKAEPVRSATFKDKQAEEIAKAVESEIKAEPVHLALNEAANHTAKKIIKTARVQSIAQSMPAKQPIKVATIVRPSSKQPTKISRPVVNKQIARVNKKTVTKKDIYAVQLASFSQLANAQALINKLRVKGYKANFVKIPTGQGNAVYKVYVGHSPRKTDVLRLKTQLASAMQLNGFVVNTGVS